MSRHGHWTRRLVLMLELTQWSVKVLRRNAFLTILMDIHLKKFRICGARSFLPRRSSWFYCHVVVVDIESKRPLVLGEIARSTMVNDKDIINISHTNQVKDLPHEFLYTILIRQNNDRILKEHIVESRLPSNDRIVKLLRNTSIR